MPHELPFFIKLKNYKHAVSEQQGSNEVLSKYVVEKNHFSKSNWGGVPHLKKNTQSTVLIFKTPLTIFLPGPNLMREGRALGPI